MDKIRNNKWMRFYFDPRGRATRYDFNIYYAVVAFVLSVLAFGIDYMLSGGDVMKLAQNPVTVSKIFNYILIVPTLVVCARRLQDLNFSGFWQLAVYAIAAWFIIAIIQKMKDPQVLMDQQRIAETMGLGFVSMAVLLVFFLVLGCVRGTKGANKYGADPLGK